MFLLVFISQALKNSVQKPPQLLKEPGSEPPGSEPASEAYQLLKLLLKALGSEPASEASQLLKLFRLCFVSELVMYSCSFQLAFVFVLGS
jgi:hypothetical protein